jgi:acetyl esterase/lipase
MTNAVAVGLGALLAGCSAFGVLNTLEPKGGVVVTRNVAYGEGERGRLDVYAPKVRRAGRPVVVFFYGGGWDSGRKDDYAWAGAALASSGYVAVVPDYRIHPHARFPDFLEDSARAVRWARDNAAAHGGDPDRLVLMGHSAGAYNAAMLALDPQWLGAVELDPKRDIRAWVGLSGPYDFLPLKSQTLMTIFGPEDQRPRTQPINHVSDGAPPALLITGDRDATVGPGNTGRLARKLREHGVEVETHYYAKIDHVRTVAAVASPLRFLAPVMADVTAFIDARAGG